MKIALLNDTHFGVRNDNPQFIEYQKRFYKDVFFPYLEKNNITTLIHLGDVVDRRKYINFNTAYEFQQNFWKELYKRGIDTHIILGNHDTYYKNTNRVNAIETMITSFDGVNEPYIYSDATDVNIGGLDICFIPWICDENQERSLETIQNSKAQIAMGHLEIIGFEMHGGHVNKVGLEKETFKRFDMVMSGHFHKKSDDSQIHYLGTQYEMTWADYKCPKHFHVFDTDTRELTAIKNEETIFKKFYYDDNKHDYTNIDIREYDNCFVKFLTVYKDDEKMYNRLVERFQKEIKTLEFNIIDDHTSDVTVTVKDDILDKGEDTMTFLGNYIEQIETDLDKEKLKTMVKELYQDSTELL